MADATTQPVIEMIPNGPCVVKGIGDFRNSRGEPIPVEPVMYLCRCGGSANKPFCDGTHKKIGFSGARLADPAKNITKNYQGRGIIIHDNRFFCSHATHCTYFAPGAFTVGRKPWIDPDGETPDKLVETIKMCPSGALSCTIGGVLHQDRQRPPAIAIEKNGPYLVTGAPALVADISPPSPEHYALCRCGHSKNKPYCDGSHWDAGFKDDKN